MIFLFSNYFPPPCKGVSLSILMAVENFFSWFIKFSHPGKEQQILDGLKHLVTARRPKQVIFLEALLACLRGRMGGIHFSFSL